MEKILIFRTGIKLHKQYVKCIMRQTLAETSSRQQVCQSEIFSCKQQGPILTNLNKVGFITILGAQGIESLNATLVRED